MFLEKDLGPRIMLIPTLAHVVAKTIAFISASFALVSYVSNATYIFVKILNAMQFFIEFSNYSYYGK